VITGPSINLLLHNHFITHKFQKKKTAKQKTAQFLPFKKQIWLRKRAKPAPPPYLLSLIVQHPLANCRLYYSQITVDPQKSIDYVQRNRNKKVIYRSFVTNSYTNITTGSSFNALVNSGIVHPTAVLICPFIGATTGTNSGFGDFQWKSPFDTCPATMSPLSLINLQVGAGGQNVLNSTLNMAYENFLQQVNLAEQLTSGDFGVSTGLISQGYWEASKWYFVNVERGNIADKLQPRNINVSFTNNSNVAIDVIISSHSTATS
jgi:hypothetical protein